ncbi:hypothetical protein D3C87_85210 [compost metagenome]
MNRFVFLFVLLLAFSHKSIGQQDSLPVQSDQKDSIRNPILSLGDSVWKIVTPWPPYPPPCIIPPKWDTFNIAHFYPTIFFESRYNAKGAPADLKSGTAQILFSGGLGGMPDFTSEKDNQFQRKYGVEFFSQGCVHMGPNEDETAYNRAIFAYLDKKFGEMWRYELRNDAIGFEAPELTYNPAELVSSASILVASLEKPSGKTANPETETAVWWYVLPTSGFALLLSLYWIIKRKQD